MRRNQVSLFETPSKTTTMPATSIQKVCLLFLMQQKSGYIPTLQPNKSRYIQVCGVLFE